MGSTQTHYAINGLMLTGDEARWAMQHREETRLNPDWTDAYYENGFKKEITRDEEGLSIVQDGMCGKYVLIGFIVGKGLECEGLSPVLFPRITDEQKEIILRRAKKLFGLEIEEHRIGPIALTHWH